MSIQTIPDAPVMKRFRLAGVTIASQEQQQAAQRESLRRMSNALRDGRVDLTQLDAPSLPTSAVYEDDDGARFIGRMTSTGPELTPFEETPEFDADNNPSAGGFLSMDRMDALRSHPDAAQSMMMSSLTSDAAMSMLARQPKSEGPSIAETMLRSSAMGLGQKLIGGQLVQLASLGVNEQAGTSLSQFVASAGSMDGLAQLGQSLASGLVSNVMGMGVQAAMSGWKVDDESSTAEHAARQAADAAIGQLQSELMSLIDEQIAKALGTAGLPKAPVPPGSSPKSMTQKATEFFTGPTSTANIPVGFLGCGDTNDGFVLTGGPTVMVNELQVSRQTDTVTMMKPIPDAGPLMSGNPTVLSMGLPTAGDGHFAVGAKGIVTLLQGCSANVLMGPQGMPVVVPTPKEAPSSSPSSDSKRASTGSGSKGAASPANKPGADNGETQAKEALPHHPPDSGSPESKEIPPQTKPAASGEAVIWSGTRKDNDESQAKALAGNRGAPLFDLKHPADLSTYDKVTINAHAPALPVFGITDSVKAEKLAATINQYLANSGFRGSEIELVMCQSGSQFQGTSGQTSIAEIVAAGRPGTTVVGYQDQVAVNLADLWSPSTWLAAGFYGAGRGEVFAMDGTLTPTVVNTEIPDSGVVESVGLPFIPGL